MTSLIHGLAVGSGLGVLFFGGLWLTVRRLPRARRPGLLAAGSFLARLLLVGAGLWWVARGGGWALAAALAALLAARELLRRALAPGPAPPAEPRPAGEASAGAAGPAGN